MNICSLFLFFIINIAYAVADPGSFLEDYSWREYAGTVPSDALEGGLDKNGKPIYIGQVLYENKLIPGKIYKGDNKIYFEWAAKAYSTNQNVKILCSQQPQKFKWLHTKRNETGLLINMLLVNGGYEPNYSTYIGRALSDGETSVGKVICNIDECLGLYTTNNEATQEHKVFQILSYNPKIPSFDIKCDQPIIDFRIGEA